LQPFLERDLKEHPDDPLTLREEQFYKPCWAEANYNNELFAVPADTDNRALYYNRDILEKYADKLIPIGCVDPNDPTKVGPPRTWDQLKQCAKILTEYDSAGRLRQVGFIPNFGNSWLYIYGWLNGGNFMSEDGRTCTLNSPAIVDALVYMTEVYDVMGGAQAVNAFQSTLQTGDLDPFLSGKVAMKIDGDGVIAIVANLKRDLRFGVTLAPAPEGKPRLGWCGGWCWIIPRNARHPEEAWEFIKYNAGLRAYQIKSEGSRQMANASGNLFIPPISARVDITKWAMDHYLYSDPSIDEKFKTTKKAFVDAMEFSKYRPVTAVGQLLWNCQVRAMEGGIYKRYDPTDIRRNAQIACDKNAAVVQKELDRIFKPKDYPTLSWTPILYTYIAVLLITMAFLYWHFDRKMQAKGYFRREFYAGYLFASPWIVGFLIFGGGPLIFSLFMSFCQYDVLSQPKFVGFDNYTTMLFHDPLFYKSLWNTIYIAIGVPLGMAVSLGIAMLLNFEVKGMAVYRTFFYLPAIMPAVAASILWIWIFNPHQGILNNLLAKVGVSGPEWLSAESWSKPAVILMGLWGAGSGMIVWLAGLKGIPAHLYEAAEIDGAGPWAKFRAITLPMLSPYILFNLIMGLIGAFQKFTEAFIMTRGGPVDSTLFYAYNLFNYAFKYMKMGYASAMAWVLFGIVLVLTVIQLRLSKRWVHYESEQ
jgi:multiple sugar transport system permease protein